MFGTSKTPAFGLGRLGQRGGGAAAFDVMSMTPLLWLDASDISTLSQDTAGATPVVNPADPTGRWADKSGGSRHFLQATGSAKPAFRQLAGKNSVNPDGVDDVLSTAGGLTWPASVDVFVVMSNAEADTSFTLLDFGAGYLGCGISGSGAPTSDVGGAAPNAYVNNVLTATRGELYANTAGGACKIVEYRGIDITSFTAIATGLSAGAPFAGRYYEIVICPANPALRTPFRDSRVTKWGVA